MNASLRLIGVLRHDLVGTEPSLGDYSQSRLWGLWDMLKVSAQHYINIGRSVGGLDTALMMLESGAGSSELLPDERAEFEKLFSKLHKDRTKLGLVTP